MSTTEQMADQVVIHPVPVKKGDLGYPILTVEVYPYSDRLIVRHVGGPYSGGSDGRRRFDSFGLAPKDALALGNIQMAMTALDKR